MTYRVGSGISSQSPRHQQHTTCLLIRLCFSLSLCLSPPNASHFLSSAVSFKSQLMLQALTQKLPPPLSLLQTSPFLLNTNPLCPPSWSSSHAYVSNLMYLIFLSRTLEIERNFVENSKEPVFYAIKNFLSPIK